MRTLSLIALLVVALISSACVKRICTQGSYAMDTQRCPEFQQEINRDLHQLRDLQWASPPPFVARIHPQSDGGGWPNPDWKPDAGYLRTLYDDAEGCMSWGDGGIWIRTEDWSDRNRANLCHAMGHCSLGVMKIHSTEHHNVMNRYGYDAKCRVQ